MKRFRVTKIKWNGEEIDYGTMNKEDVKLVTKGYKFNGLFYERKNSKNIFVVDEL